jgi:hypothetical protein
MQQRAPSDCRRRSLDRRQLDNSEEPPQMHKWCTITNQSCNQVPMLPLTPNGVSFIIACTVALFLVR